MRIALPRLVDGGRAAAEWLPDVVRAVDAAAGLTPAPDLVALPQFSVHGRHRRAHAAQFVGVREALAGKAREWGVYIAFGLRCRGVESSQPAVGLLDPDGDVAAADDVDGAGPPGYWSRSLQTPAGCIAVADPRRSDATLFEGMPPSVVLVVPCGADHASRLTVGPAASVFAERSGPSFLAVARCVAADASPDASGADVYDHRAERLIPAGAATCVVVDVTLEVRSAVVVGQGGSRRDAGPDRVVSNRPCAEPGS